MKVREYFKSGDAWVWLNAGAVAISLIMVAGILGLIAVRGLGHFWPADVMQAQYSYLLLLVDQYLVSEPKFQLKYFAFYYRYPYQL